MSENNEKHLLELDYLGTVCWFAMDACWMLGLSFAAHALILPTLVLTASSLIYIQRNVISITGTAACLSWLLMNISWMCQDLGTFPSGVKFGTFFLAVGLLFFGSGLIATRGSRDGLTDLFRRLRRRPPIDTTKQSKPR